VVRLSGRLVGCLPFDSGRDGLVRLMSESYMVEPRRETVDDDPFLPQATALGTLERLSEPALLLIVRFHSVPGETLPSERGGAEETSGFLDGRRVGEELRSVYLPMNLLNVVAPVRSAADLHLPVPEAEALRTLERLHERALGNMKPFDMFRQSLAMTEAAASIVEKTPRLLVVDFRPDDPGVAVGERARPVATGQVRQEQIHVPFGVVGPALAGSPRALEKLTDPCRRIRE
jgi:hypothetical protein